jgi:patatin-related protein
MPYLPYEPSSEVRLGLVLYGGVSLAIYINGVAREFFCATRGQGVYSLIKGLTDSDIGVDIVSGTSAGGINGIFLGFALCNEREFAGFGKLWRDLGDISKLMRDPSRDPDATKSLLDSEGYYQPSLAASFASLTPVTASEYEFVTAVHELDLFITGTDVYGDISTVFDDSGNPVDLKNHRAIFQLKHRAGRKEPFKPALLNNAPVPSADDLTFQSLARLARLTSAFPVAFTPVFVADASTRASTVDGRLQCWGALGRAAWFIDGGVLNNKPFTSTLHEIFYRMANREVERRVMYVEPAPERFDPNHDPAEPTVFNTVGDPSSASPAINRSPPI